MLALENADEILQILDRFTKQKSKDIPPELEDYINYVAKTGDTVYRWPSVQYLFREKLRNVIKEFHDTTASIEDLPQCPNVDQFNYESMKTLLFERFDCFQAAPFTIQRLCELLTDPKKHYSRLDKFMRALEKNILVVSTVEPGRKPMPNDHDNEFNDDLMPEINIDDVISKNDEMKKNDEKQTNGTKKEHNDFNSNDHKNDVVASSSAQALSSDADVKMEEEDDVNTKVETETETETVSVKTDEPTVNAEPETSNNQSADVTTTESIDKKTEMVDQTDVVTEKPDTTSETVNDDKKIETIEKIDTETKAETVEQTAKSIPIDEKPDVVDEKIETEEIKPIEENKPSTPKHGRSSSDDEDDGDANNSAKKIRLEMDDEIDEKPNDVTKETDTSNEQEKPAVADLQKETDILESISSEIDAQKENELLDEVVDSALPVDKEPINIEVPPVGEKEIDAPKPTEESPAATDDATVVTPIATDSTAAATDSGAAEATPATVAATDELLKTDEPVAIPTDLDFTPDEALNELVSSDILSVIPEQPVEEEVKMNEESAVTPAAVNTAEPIVPAPNADIVTTAATVTPADEMAVENTETNTAEAENVENAMEAAPIKPDEEQMDVDESNSVDAMDL